jgi:hypothetical protein
MPPGRSRASIERVSTFLSDLILPPPPDGARAVLHDREYRVRAFLVEDDRVVIQGAIRDQQPPGAFVPSDPEPLVIHHMQVSLTVSFPDLTIVDVDTHYEMHPHDECPTITEHYKNLIGLSIARGFTHKVRELFGGPRACTHVTALLQAMAPVAVQCFWSWRRATAPEQVSPEQGRAPQSPLRDDGVWRRNVNTCHVWAEDGEMVPALEAGTYEYEVPVFLRARLAKLGIDPTQAGGAA